MTAKGALLTARDLALVCDLYKYRYLSVRQIQRLHFPSLQTTYRRLRALSALGYLAGFLAPHIPEHIYYLEQKGAQLVADALGVEATELKWASSSKKPKDYYFLRHFLATTEFRLALQAACRQSDLELLGFIPEYYGEKTKAGGVVKYIKDVVCDVQAPAEKISHTPDAVFALAKRALPALFFLEIDRGTEVVSDPSKGVLKCARFYLQYLLSGGYQRYQQDFGCASLKGFRALFVTTSEQRITHIRQAISKLEVDPRAKQFLWLTEQHRIQPSGILQPIWVSADLQDANIYQIG